MGDQPRATLVWATDEILYTPEVAVANVHVKEIGEYMDHDLPGVNTHQRAGAGRRARPNAPLVPAPDAAPLISQDFWYRAIASLGVSMLMPIVGAGSVVGVEETLIPGIQLLVVLGRFLQPEEALLFVPLRKLRSITAFSLGALLWM